MTLRFLLVSLVASMGFELPSGRDVSTWTRTGREWLGAQVAGLSSLPGEAEPALECSTDRERSDDIPALPEIAGSPAADLAFDVVVEGMASDFAADLAAIPADRPGLDSAPDAVTDDGRVVEPVPLAVLAEPNPGASIEEPSSAAEAPARSARVDRLSAAVRLTRQALHAWASLIEGSPDAVAAAH